MKSDLILSSLVYKFSEKVLVKAIGFIIGIILARIIDPNIFGVVAIINAVVAIGQVFVDSGLSTALIQSKELYDDDYSTIFCISISISVVLYGILYFLTPIITEYYKIIGYEAPFRGLLIVIIFYAINSIQSAKLQRDMLFKRMMSCQLIAVSISGCVGIVMACMQKGIWALVCYYVSNSVVTCITYCFASRLKLRLKFSIHRAKKLVNYGYKIFISGLLCSLFSNMRTFVIGRQFTTIDLALYSRGDQIPSIVSTSIDGSFNAVMLPAFSKEQDKPMVVLKLLKKMIMLDSIIIFPSMVGLAAVAKNLIPVLFTEKWIQSIPYLQILALANLHVAITPLCLSAIKAIGRSDITLTLEIVRRVVMLAILFVSICFHSLIAIAIGWLVSTTLDIIIIMIPTRKIIGYSFYDLSKDVLPVLLISLFMGAVVYFIGDLSIPSVAELIIQILGGIVLYLFALKLILPEQYKSLKGFITIKRQ